MISTNDFRTGVTVTIDGDAWQVVEFQHVKPGKGAAFVRAKMRNLCTGAVVERTFNAAERMPKAIVERRAMQYLYKNGDNFVFMVHLNPYVLHLRGQNQKVKYLVGVATDPVARGQHKMGELLATTFNLLRAAGHKVAILEPINAGIYQPYGFAYTFNRLKYALPLAELTVPYVDYDLPLRQIKTSEAEATLAPIYAQAM